MTHASGDPFHAIAPTELVRMKTAKPTASLAGSLPYLGGVFISGSLRGALLDGEVVFVGDTVGESCRLLEVASDRVRILYHEHEVDLVYDPVNASMLGNKIENDENGDQP